MGAGASSSASLQDAAATISNMLSEGSDAATTFSKSADTMNLLRWQRQISTATTFLQRELGSRFQKLGVLPPSPRALCDNSFEFGSEEHKKIMQETVQYIVEVAAPLAYCSEVAKANLRQLLSIGREFTINLHWGEAWDPLMKGCVAHMHKLGAELDTMYRANHLKEIIGSYRPPLLLGGESPTNTGSGRSTQKAALGHQQLVPPPCASSVFLSLADDDVVQKQDLESAYVHFLRLLALAYDQPFRESVNNALLEAGIELVGGSVTGGGIKSYERMVNKMESAADHRYWPKPRPAFNIDVVRCLATFHTAADMRRAFDVVARDVFGGSYIKFKNGMAWDDDTAASRYHLRVVLATGSFGIPLLLTLGNLRKNSVVQATWNNYLESEPIPVTVSRETWKKQVNLALEWLRELPDDTNISLLCEVQMLLRNYTLVRTSMHDLYKIARASNPDKLYNDFAKYRREADMQTEFEKAGNSDLTRACRDGLSGSLLEQLSAGGVQAHDMSQALSVACKFVRPRCVQHLLDHGSVPQSALGPALLACAMGTPCRSSFTLDVPREEILRKLISSRADVNFQSDDGESPLFGSARHGFSNLATVLLQSKANADATGAGGISSLLAAARHGHVDVVRLLLDGKANVEFGDGESAPIKVAALYGRVHVVDALIQAKANVDAASPDGANGLIMAAQDGHVDVVHMLVRAKANVLAAEEDGCTPLYMAAQHGYLDVVELLIGCKADVNAADSSNVTGLYLAAQNNHFKVVERLLSAGASFENVSDGDHNTPLLAAAENGCLDVIVLLLQAKANCFTCRAPSGWSPLHVACAGGYLDCVKQLLQQEPGLQGLRSSSECELHKRSIPCGASAQDVAELFHHKEVVNFLEGF